MRKQKTAYELRDSQVDTPKAVVDLFWNLVHKRRAKLGSVLDTGAGDGRFAIGGNYQNYVGIEIDLERAQKAAQKCPGKIEHGCAFRHQGVNYDACIGNPPYVRHHDIESPWKEQTVTKLEKELNIQLDRHGNLYLYFLCLGIIKTKNDGIVGMVIPFEWVSRPSAKALRELIQTNKWDVSIYRFDEQIFPGVLTTASISIIDKSKKTGKWNYFNIDSNFKFSKRLGMTGSSQTILPHEARGRIWARRGLSPGTQKIFTLTDGERIHAGLSLCDVSACVTSLRNFPKHLNKLDKNLFQEYFVNAGERCWLIKSNRPKISLRLKNYLTHIPEKVRQTYTCLNQDPWYKYENVEVPSLLFHSGFNKFGPKVIVNELGAHAVGSVYGIHSVGVEQAHSLQRYLIGYDFESRVVAHAKTLKKVEVRQLNAVLSAWQ